MRFPHSRPRPLLLILLLFLMMTATLLSIQSNRTNRAEIPASLSMRKLPDAELFDVKKEQVVRLLPTDDRLRQEAIRWLDAGSGAAQETAFEPRGGIGLRIPFIPPVEVNKPWYHGPVRELFLFVEKPAGPHRLLFIDDQSRMHLIVLPYDLKPFLKAYHIEAPV
ncbi:hypothetical protein [Gorillibacterium sp. CAU 1737]|uniref:hypothetical protein n=1 Tax=Gorillibacterium sp. CAU 1737 TaxID=3140362 RepID=UPI003260CFB9